jgi:hypothetical protein
MVGQIRPQAKFLALAIALLLGGAIGNVYDRISYGYVIDFIHVYYQTWHFPIFNIADCAITVGAIMLIIDSLFLEKKATATNAKIVKVICDSLFNPDFKIGIYIVSNQEIQRIGENKVVTTFCSVFS